MIPFLAATLSLIGASALALATIVLLRFVNVIPSQLENLSYFGMIPFAIAGAVVGFLGGKSIDVNSSLSSNLSSGLKLVTMILSIFGCLGLVGLVILVVGLELHPPK